MSGALGTSSEDFSCVVVPHEVANLPMNGI
jgi:hypothetical protein